MKKTLNILITLLISLLISCGGKDEKKKDGFSYEKKAPTETKAQEQTEKVLPSKKVDLSNKGVGPIKNVELNAQIDEEMVARGMELFKTNCSACHKVDKRFIGPSPKGIMNRRSPEWIMNMTLNVEQIPKEDPTAKE